MKAWVEEQAGTGRYSNASDYVRDLTGATRNAPNSKGRRASIPTGAIYRFDDRDILIQRVRHASEDWFGQP